MDLNEIARRLRVADADIRSVDWVDGECYVTMADGLVKMLQESGFAVVERVPDPAPEVEEEESQEEDPDPVPDGNAKTVMEWVDGDAERAQKAIDAEQVRVSPRKVLIADLTKIARAT